MTLQKGSADISETLSKETFIRCIHRRLLNVKGKNTATTPHKLTQKSSVIPLAGSGINTKIPRVDMLLKEMVTKFSNLVILQRGTLFQK